MEPTPAAAVVVAVAAVPAAAEAAAGPLSQQRLRPVRLPSRSVS